MNELITDVLKNTVRREGMSFWSSLFKSGQMPLYASYEPGDVWEPKLGSPNFLRTPRVIYFYYLKLNADGSLTAEEYRYFNKVDPNAPDPGPDEDVKDHSKFTPIEPRELDSKVADLINNARRPQGIAKSYPVEDFQDLTWKRRCYVVIFFDEENWKLYDHKDVNNKNKSPILFMTKKSHNGKLGSSNHTFYDATFPLLTFTNNDGNKETKSYFSFINYMKEDETGQSEVGPSINGQYFCFNVLIEVYFANKKNPPLLVIFDPGGTNEGPPIEP